MSSIVDVKDEKDFRAATELFLSGKMDVETFKKVRLLHGVYVQRQAEQPRSDSQPIASTPRYMLRARIPAGRLTSQQLERIADLSDSFAGGIGHITTRQNIQFYGMDLKQVSEMIHRLAEAGITTRETSGNVVRNITACYLSGVCPIEIFDVTPYAEVLSYFLIRHPEFQNLPRKFKISLSGCENDHGLAAIHDLGFIASQKDEKYGFKVLVGGGLGSVPRAAHILQEFIPTNLFLPTCLTVVSVFNQYGDRTVRAKSRLKFLIEKLGIEEFRKMVVRENIKKGIYER